jgi:hypothetical protein
VVMLNFSAWTAVFKLPENIPYSSAGLLIGNYPAAQGEDPHRLSLQPYEARVYRLT